MKIRYIIWYTINIVLSMNLWYLTIAFCSVYGNSTKSWIFGGLITILIWMLMKLILVFLVVGVRELAQKYHNE